MPLRKRSSENFRRPFVIEEGLGLQYQPLALLLPLRLVVAVSGVFTLIFTLLLGFLSLRLAFSAAGLALAVFFLPFSDDVAGALAGWALLRRLNLLAQVGVRNLIIHGHSQDVDNFLSSQRDRKSVV